MTLGELMGPEAKLPEAWESVPIAGLAADSRQVKPGYLFAALPGVKMEGTRFIDDAVKPTFLPRSREEGMANAPRVLKAQTSASLLKLMRLNVLKGTGKRANAEGYRVGGKTGTADKVVGRHYSNTAVLTSFLSAFPTDAPEYLVLVMLDEPQRVEATHFQATAGVNSAPTAGKIIERIGPILGVAPRLPEDQRQFDAKVLASY